MEERAKLFAIPERLTSIAAWTRILASRHWRKRVASWSAFLTPRLPVVIGARALPRRPLVPSEFGDHGSRRAPAKVVVHAGADDIAIEATLVRSV